MDKTDSFKILSCNLNGISTKDKRLKVIKTLNEYKANIIFLQETHTSKISEWRGFSYVSPARGRSCGTAILLRNSPGLSIVSSANDCNGRVVSVVCSISGKQINMVSAYAPNNPACRRQFFQEVMPNFLEPSMPNILAGDFNCVDSLPLDTLSHAPGSSTTIGSVELDSCVNAFGMKDQWRSDNPTLKAFTWSNRQGTLASRLDKVYISEDLTLLRQEHSFFPYSDHRVVIAEIDIDYPATRRKSSMGWKLNTSVLKEEAYQVKIQRLINDSSTLIDAFANPLIWWDDFKLRVKAVSIAYCAKRKKERNIEIDNLKNQLETAQIGQEVGKIKDKLKEMQDKKLEGLAVRARCTKELQDERCTAYFFDRIRQRREKNNVVGVKNNKGEIETEDAKILEVYREFYQKLYSKHDESPDGLQWLISNSTIDRSQLSREQEREGSGEVTFEADELRTVVSEMASNKSPGPDGIPVEFYKVFFGDIVWYLIQLFEYINDNNMVPQSMTEAVTVLIQKAGDKTDPANQRPISLLNTDYKMLMKYINEVYLQPQLETVIDSEQLCAVKGRSIHDGLCLIRDVIEYSRKVDCSGFIVSLDQKKAFDLVSHEVLFAAMDHFELPSKVISLVRTLYKSVTTRISVNGQLSDILEIQRGVRQGCPLSASLYVLYIQMFLRILKKDDWLQGINIPGGTVKISVYADDLVIFCADEGDINKTFSFFERVAEISGSQLNQGKTQILCLSRCRPSRFCDMIAEEIKVCGVFFSRHSADIVTSANMNRILQKIKQKTLSLARFSLTLRGRVLLSNSIIFSQLSYISGVYLPSSKFFEEIRKMIFQFIWGEGRREVISRKTIETTVDNGGLGLVRLKEKCQAIHLEHNLYRPCSLSFDHQRVLLFMYFFGLWSRKMAPHTYSISAPHCFTQQGVYIEVDRLRRKLWDFLERTGFQHVSIHQSCVWLCGKEDPVVIKVPKEVDDDVYKERVFTIWKDGLISIKNIDFMWRIALGGIKTGDFIARYKMPGVRVDCLFCPEVRESAEHLFCYCRSLLVVRRMAINILKNIDVIFDFLNDNQYKMLFCLGLAPKKQDKSTERKIFSVIAETNRVIWTVRNEVLFSYEKKGVERIVTLLQPILDRIMKDNNDD